ncbi:PREDICTED: glycosyltransferase 6 domain-containing protein 1-like [Galeopterus variegatus]|uniref:Glycosyltransferase 6 domain-containing protein 1-like n=1 Tax=Galeopterus variegatus TaxID=482537 RepID=A0ABM0Q0S4_GALVR|nr:PREDICTED: glycosyltransferase 6 domain-containing protein 1-like [Galeopterus variegatus]
MRGVVKEGVVLPRSRPQAAVGESRSCLFHRNRPDVITRTNWRAPVVWEGTFNRDALGKYYGRQNLTVGLAVFAAGRLAGEHLKLFLTSASKYFMTGYRVVVYVIADVSFQLPDLEPSPLRTFQIFRVEEEDLWHDHDVARMRSLGQHVLWHIQYEVDFLFSMPASQVFQNDFGVETLGTSVAQLHAWWYFQNTKNVPYERRPKSAAYIPFGQGDFYYDGSVVGGTPHEMLNLIQNYLSATTQDIKHGLNSTYERHLNKYFFLNKPTKLLSPEYSWDLTFTPPAQIRYVKLVRHSQRNYDQAIEFID